MKVLVLRALRRAWATLPNRRSMHAHGILLPGLMLGVATWGSVTAADNPAEVFELPTVTVVGNTPLPGIGIPLRDMPANVQFWNSKDIARQAPADATHFLERNANSVSLNSAQGNPNQQELAFRGFAASPLLGTPQGLSVFQDGVRINEAFGDIVNWDLLPRSAISSIQLIPGSNPVFGLNTLGGALSIHTKSGAQHPGTAVEAAAGSFGRRAVEFEHGGQRGKLDYFATGNVADDRGWAEHNPSRIRQFFGKVGFQDARVDLDLSLTLADNTLQGTQTLPSSFLDTRRQAYTYPDTNRNRLVFVAAKGSVFISDDNLLSATVYRRYFRNSNSSSNVNPHYGLSEGDDDDVQLNEANDNRSVVNQTSAGGSGQLTYSRPLGSLKNQLVIGVSADWSSTSFVQDETPSMFSSDRGTVAAGDAAPTANVNTTSHNRGIYLVDTLNLTPQLTLTISGRADRTQVEIRDRSGNAPGLNGTHTFARFNPAAGVSFSPSGALTSWLSYSEGMRAPTPIELTCAQADAPCSLPNIFLADPPLNMIVSRTVEAGIRGRPDAQTSWSAAVYQTELADDIQFINSGTTGNAGYFRNIGQSRRRGLELAGNGQWGPVEIALRYSLTDATFQSTFSAYSPFNSLAAEDGGIMVRAGSRIPSIPRHTLKMRIG
ncbi:MAG: TonB-dependent receptor, partial [Betaproteobacteria bacterium]